MARSKLVLQFDPRSLVLFRLAIGVIAVATAVIRLFHFEAFFSSTGLAANAPPLAWSGWSVHSWMEKDGWQVGLMASQIVFGLALIWGVRPHLVTAVLAYLSVSHNLRFWMFATGYEVYLPWIFTLGFLLPLDGKRRASGWMAGLYMAWLGATYWGAGLVKSGAGWSDGTALVRYLGASGYTTSWGERLSDYPGLLTVAGRILPYFEVAVPCFLMVATLASGFRLALCLVMIGFHAFLTTVFHVEEISFICMALWLPLVPRSFWTAIGVPAVPEREWQIGNCVRVVAVSSLVVIALMYAEPIWLRVSGGGFGWTLLGTLRTHTGFNAEFNHFANSAFTPAWFRVLASSDPGAPARWPVEIRLPENDVVDTDGQAWPADLYHSRFGGTRYWLKFLSVAEYATSGWLAKAVRDYICLRFGPGSTHGLFHFRVSAVERPWGGGPPLERQLFTFSCPR